MKYSRSLRVSTVNTSESVSIGLTQNDHCGLVSSQSLDWWTCKTKSVGILYTCSSQINGDRENTWYGGMTPPEGCLLLSVFGGGAHQGVGVWVGVNTPRGVKSLQWGTRDYQCNNSSLWNFGRQSDQKKRKSPFPTTALSFDSASTLQQTWSNVSINLILPETTVPG